MTSKILNNRGFTLIEILVAMAMAGIVMVAIVSAYQIQVKGKNIQEITTDMNQTARAAMEIMASEIRLAGCDPEGDADAGIETAKASELEFKMDIGGDPDIAGGADGDTNDVNETIRYALNNDADGNGIADGSPCDLGRDTGGGLQTLAENIDGLNFVYIDYDGDVLSTPVTGGDLDDIRMIQVTLVARGGEQLRGFTGSHTDTNTYDNEGTWLTAANWTFDPDDDLGADADKFRRIQLTKTIYLRNMGR